MSRPAHLAAPAGGDLAGYTDHADAAAAKPSADASFLPSALPCDGLSGLLTVAQAADWLQVSPSTIRSYVREGRLPAFRIAGVRSVRIPRQELLKLLEPTS
jgi:excisionase family DNA binding protein